MTPSRSPHYTLTLLLPVVLTVATNAAAQAPKPQTRPAPSTAKPAPARPSTSKPSAAKPAQPAAKAAVPEIAKAPEPPPPPPPQDVRFKSTYTNGDMKTESVAYLKGDRERFEFQDMILLKQPDQKRTVQISKTANTYLVAPDGSGTTATPDTAGSASRPPGVVMVAISVVDTGERKTTFGQQARHVKMMIDKQPMPGACDANKQRIETDGWYIDAPAGIASKAAPARAPQGGADDCADDIRATTNGDAKALGFPVAYTTTITGDDGKPLVSSMEVTEFETLTLDAALFEIPPGLTAAMNVRELSKALSDANEAKLVASAAAPAAPAPKAPGVVRIAVPEFTNKTPQSVDTRALRQRLVNDLTDAKFEAVPLAAASPAELQKRAAEIGADYVLVAEVSELKANKPGAFGGLMKAAAGVAGGRGGMVGAAAGAAGAMGSASAPTENTESTVQVKLLQADGKQRLSTTAKGKDGSGFSLKSGLGLAKFAGGMYLSMMAGPMFMSKMNALGAYNMGGMGMLGNPMLYRMQGAGMAGLGKGMGMDATAGAAAYLMGTAMQMNNLGGLVGVPGQGPSYDESLGEAVQNAAKAVEKALTKK